MPGPLSRVSRQTRAGPKCTKGKENEQTLDVCTSSVKLLASLCSPFVCTCICLCTSIEQVGHGRSSNDGRPFISTGSYYEASQATLKNFTGSGSIIGCLWVPIKQKS